MSLGSGTAQPVARGGTPPRPRVLVVEDEPAIARVVAGYLEREGFEVAVAGEGHAALDLARDREPDVVVLDLMLPGIGA